MLFVCPFFELHYFDRPDNISSLHWIWICLYLSDHSIRISLCLWLVASAYILSNFLIILSVGREALEKFVMFGIGPCVQLFLYEPEKDLFSHSFIISLSWLIGTTINGLLLIEFSLLFGYHWLGNSWALSDFHESFLTLVHVFDVLNLGAIWLIFLNW